VILLKENLQEFQNFEIDEMDEQEILGELLFDKTAKTSVPYVFVNGEYIGGYTALETWVNKQIKV
jgi:glutaredoxin